MARFIPSKKPKNFNNSYGEMKVYEALSSLNNDYTVFYSLSWISSSYKRTLGEADFVVIHANLGLLVIEVKSGEILFNKGEWIQTNSQTRHSKKIDPFGQASKSQYELRDRLKGLGLDIMTCYAVWFPSIEKPDEKNLPLESPSEIVLDNKSLNNAEEAIVNSFSFWRKHLKLRKAKLSRDQLTKVISAICPYFRVVPSLKTRIKEAGEYYFRLTNQQMDLLDALAEQDTAFIHGPAGTGKTILAIEKAKRIAESGERVLFLCYNSFLRNHLKLKYTMNNLEIHNVHSFAYKMLMKLGFPSDKLKSSSGKPNYSLTLFVFKEYLHYIDSKSSLLDVKTRIALYEKEVQDKLRQLTENRNRPENNIQFNNRTQFDETNEVDVKGCLEILDIIVRQGRDSYLDESIAWPYKNIIIDEGQDLDDDLLILLHKVIHKKQGCFYVFFDRNQYILKNKMPYWLEKAGRPFVLNKNCRNTAEVFKTSCGFIGIEGITLNEVHGEIPAVRLYHNSEELYDIVDGFISRVIKEGLTPSDIVILTSKTVFESSIDIRKSYGGQNLSTDGRNGKILFTSIRKFKGLEAEGVIIVDSSVSELELPENRRLLYVGSSRAKNLLNIALLADVESKETDILINGIAQGIF